MSYIIFKNHIFVNFVLNIYNFSMDLLAREQIKILLAQEKLNQKELAAMITEKTGKICLPNSLSQKMRRGTLSYNEMLTIAKILGYKIEFKKVEEV